MRLPGFWKSLFLCGDSDDRNCASPLLHLQPSKHESAVLEPFECSLSPLLFAHNCDKYSKLNKTMIEFNRTDLLENPAFTTPDQYLKESGS